MNSLSLDAGVAAFLAPPPTTGEPLPSILVVQTAHVELTIKRLKDQLATLAADTYDVFQLVPGKIDQQLPLPLLEVKAALTQDDYPRDGVALLASQWVAQWQKPNRHANRKPILLLWGGFSQAHPLEQEFIFSLLRFSHGEAPQPPFRAVFVDAGGENNFIATLQAALYQINPKWLPILVDDEQAKSPSTKSRSPGTTPNQVIDGATARGSWFSEWQDCQQLLTQNQGVAYLVKLIELARNWVQQPKLPSHSILEAKAAVDPVVALIRSREFSLAHDVADGAIKGMLEQPAQMQLVLPLLMQQARAQRYQANFTAALRTLSRVRELLGDANDQHQLKEVQSLELTIALLTDDLKTLNGFDFSVLDKQPPKSAVEVQLQVLAGHSRAKQDDPATAILHYRKAAAAAKRLGYTIGEANAVQSIALSMQNKGEVAGSVIYLEQAAALFKTCAHAVGELSCRMSLATLHLEQLELAKALPLLQHCERWWSQWHLKRELATAMALHGKLLHLLGYRHEGLSKLRFAAWLARDHQGITLARNTYWEVCLSELVDGNELDAQLSLDEAAKIVVATPDNVAKKIAIARQLWQTVKGGATPAEITKILQEISECDAALGAELAILAVRLVAPTNQAGDAVKLLLDKVGSLPRYTRFIAYRAILTASDDPFGGKSLVSRFDTLLNAASADLPPVVHQRFLDSLQQRRAAGAIAGSRISSGTPVAPKPITIVAQSEAMRQLLSEVERVAPLTVPIVIQGESGSGKELIARRLHELSPRHNGALVSVSCATISDDLFESQFFGYQRGAFTGAHDDQPGFFEKAQNGTLFMDNIDELSLANQAKLLRTLQEGEVRRVGGTKPIAVDVRIIVATQQPLKDLVEKQRFRLDLFFRLDVITLDLPPLRERRDDILPLITHYLANQTKGKSFILSTEAQQALLQCRWPGNVRELFNELERLSVMNRQNSQVEKRDLSRRLFASEVPTVDLIPALSQLVLQMGLTEAMKFVERGVLEELLKRQEGNIKQLAKLINIPRSSLHFRLGKIDKEK